MLCCSKWILPCFVAGLIWNIVVDVTKGERYISYIGRKYWCVSINVIYLVTTTFYFVFTFDHVQGKKFSQLFYRIPWMYGNGKTISKQKSFFKFCSHYGFLLKECFNDYLLLFFSLKLLKKIWEWVPHLKAPVSLHSW